MTTVKIVVAYHSGFGHTERLAQSVRDGAASVEGATTSLIRVDEIVESGWDALDAADAIIFGSPVYMGNVSAKFAEFSEATSKKWQTQEWKDKLAGGFVNSGGPSGDKLQALQALTVLAGQHGMQWVSHGVLPGGMETTAINRLSFHLGVGTQSDVDKGAEDMAKGDLESGAGYGRRVAEAAKVVAAGRAALAA
ncbi:MAG: flavodoxin family protein [Stackebrandtia sp.]